MIKNNKHKKNSSSSSSNNGYKYATQQIAIIKEIANERIVDIMEALDIYDGMSDRPKYINGRCPLHGGDNPTAFSWNFNMGIFKCFTNQCCNGGNDVFALVGKLKKYDFYASIQWIIDVLDINLDELHMTDVEMADVKFIKKSKQCLVKDTIIGNGILEKLKPTDYVTKERGFDPELVKRYQPRMGDSNIIHKMNNRVVFPVRNRIGDIVGFTGRKIVEDGNKKNPKWFNSPEFNKNQHLLNINFAAKHIQKTRVAVVTEGFFDIMKFESAGVHNSLGLSGISMSQEQTSLLLSVGTFLVIVALDNNKAGKKGKDKIVKHLQNFCDVAVFEIPDGYDDVGEMNVDDIKREYERLVRTYG